MLDGNNVSGIKKVQLEVAGSAAMSVRGENILPKPRVANLSLNSFDYCSSRASRDVLNVRGVGVGDFRHGHDVLRMLRAAMKRFELVDVGREELGPEADGDFVVLPRLRSFQSFPPNLEGERPFTAGSNST